MSAIGAEDRAAGDGPAFSRLARRYNAISLERRFAEVSAHGYYQMPPVEFTRADAKDLIAYLDSLQRN